MKERLTGEAYFCEIIDRKNSYMEIINKLDDFNDRKVNDINREELKQYLKSITILERKDLGRTITLNIPDNSGLDEVVIIYSVDNKICVNNDRLWKTVFGIKEMLQENGIIER